MSVCDPGLKVPITPFFTPTDRNEDSREISDIKNTLKLQAHPEGGFFVETDRDSMTVPNPYATLADITDPGNATRNASTSIYYFLTPTSPQGNFHRNKGRTVHTLHSGRGRYVLIHADDAKAGEKARIETFIVGHNLAKGERLQWIVDGGKYKASYLLPDEDSGNIKSQGLLISETVIPGFDYRDHDFLEKTALPELVTAEQASELAWLVRKE